MAPKHLPNDPTPSSSTSKDEEEREQVESDEEEDQDDTIQTCNDAQKYEDEKEENKDQEENGNEVDSEKEEDQEESVHEADNEEAEHQEEPKTFDEESKHFVSRYKSRSDTEWTPSLSQTVSGSNVKNNRERKSPKYRSINAIMASTQPVETEFKKNSKKRKVVNVGNDENSKNVSSVTGLWSGEDEIALLTSMINYQSKKGWDPDTNMGEFQKHMKNKLSFTASKIHLNYKIKRLRYKYENNAKRGENGEDPVFNNPINHKIFKLSEKIWGNLANTDGVDNDSGTIEKKKEVSVDVEIKAEQDCFGSKFPFLKESLRLLNCPSGSESQMYTAKEVMLQIGSSKSEELENKWRQLYIKEMELYIEKSKLIQRQGKLIVDLLKKNVV